MVRKTTTKNKIAAQWNAAWALLPSEWRVAIYAFLMNADRDVGATAMHAD